MCDLPGNIRGGERRSSSVSSLVRRTRPRLLALFAALFVFNAISSDAEPISRTVTLTWDASPSADVIGYRVHYGTHSGAYSNLVDVGNTTAADIANLIDGTTYFFAITAYNAGNEESVPSDEFVHTVNPGVLLNISARANVQNGDDVLIAGFIIGGSSRKTVVVRALGPSLAANVAAPLGDPTLSLFGPTGNIIASNDNWRDGDADGVIARNLAPQSDAESAVVITLPPGTYTAVVRGGGGSTGVALVEVYDAGVPAL
ncbi:MAG: fibronectin type III domain-containing protein [Chthoniobacterales bacterium]